jgi:hypothetical protein
MPDALICERSAHRVQLLEAGRVRQERGRTAFRYSSSDLMTVRGMVKVCDVDDEEEEKGQRLQRPGQLVLLLHLGVPRRSALRPHGRARADPALATHPHPRPS